ncbi:hypothetical protein L1887_10654 [Cichorium endivia]|nr:hypothetical protein L1887_10654 [Cichorium endivia]
MMASSTTKSYGTSIIRKTLQRSISAPGKFCSSSISSSLNQISDNRWGPPLISISRGCVSASTFVRVSVDHRNVSPGPSVASSSSREKNQSVNHANNKKACSDGKKKTTHPGSLQCSLQKNVSDRNPKNSNSELSDRHRLYVQRRAMTNSLVKIGTVEGDLMKRALASLIRPSAHHQRRRSDFQPMPSRLSIMSKAED